MHTRVAAVPFGGRLTDALTAARAPLLFGVRLWVSVCLALFVAFWLELDNPFWAGTSAAIVCQPQLGASLRKGWFRMIGTVVGAIMIVVLTACFPQDRVAFLVLLALWGAACAFVATVLHNFASYAAALAGYTAMIIAANTLGATGGPSPQVFMLAIWRASEICLGIVCAGIVLAGTDFGGAQRRLATSFADLAGSIARGFTRMLARAGSDVHDAQAERRELVRRVIALDPAIDQALGESGHMRTHSPTLQSAVYGLFRALDGWRGVAAHLQRPDESSLQARDIILRSIPAEWRSLPASSWAERWMADPLAARRVCAQALRTLRALPAASLSLRLLVDETVRVLDGILHALDGLALLVDAPGRRPHSVGRSMRPSVADWLPALVNAGRTFVVMGALELFWVATAWPNGASAMQFAATVVLLLSPRGDLAYGGAIAFAFGIAGAVLCAGMVKFAVLPGLELLSGLLPGDGSVLDPRRLRDGAKPSSRCGGCVRGHERQCHTAHRPYQSDELRYRAVLQRRDVGGGRLPRRAAGVFPVAVLVAGAARAPPAQVRIARLAPPRHRSGVAGAGGLAAAHVQPPCGIAGPGRAVTARATVGHALRRLCNHRASAQRPANRRGRGTRRRLASPRAGTWRGSDCATAATGAPAGHRFRQMEMAVVLRARSRMLVVAEALAEHGSYFDTGTST